MKVELSAAPRVRLRRRRPLQALPHEVNAVSKELRPAYASNRVTPWFLA